jgi:LysM repeat protein
LIVRQAYSIFLLFLIAFTAGCNLITAVPTTEVAALPTNQPLATHSTTGDPAATEQLSDGSNCTPRADWTFIYTVVSGDTLVDIASRASTSADALAQANCLANADNIAIGQQLRLPQAPTSNSIPTGAQTYVTYTNTLPGLGIAFEFPSTWTVLDNPNNLLLQDSSGNSFEIIYSDAGSTTPANEVAAQCKSAGACIGNRTVISESNVTLPSGLTGYRLDMSAGFDSGSTPMSETFMVVNNRNLAIRGFGDLNIYNTILNTLRIYIP